MCNLLSTPYITNVKPSNDKNDVLSLFSHIIDLKSARNHLSSIKWITLSNDKRINDELRYSVLNEPGLSLDILSTNNNRILVVDCYLIPSEYHMNFMMLNDELTKLSITSRCKLILFYGYDTLTMIHSKAYLGFLGYKEIGEDVALMTIEPSDEEEIQFPTPSISFDIVD